jgi:hypothetical protein
MFVILQKVRKDTNFFLNVQARVYIIHQKSLFCLKFEKKSFLCMKH